MNQDKQRGVTLAISLIILLIATLIAISLINTTQVQEKMSYNLQNKHLSFEAAESALKSAENWLLGLSDEPIPVTSCNSYPCVKILDTTFYAEDKTDSWWQANSAVYSQTLTDIKTAPRYIIEFIRFVPDAPAIGKGIPAGTYYYRITARGTGTTDNAITILQTTLARRY